MNKVVLIGRLAANPEVRYTQSGKAVCTFALAVNGRGEDKEATFIDIVAWDKLAENCGNYLVKGRRVGVDGRLNVRRFETAEGQKRKVTEVVAGEVEFLDAPKNGAGGGSAAAASAGRNATPADFSSFGRDVLPEEEIPF